MLRLPEEVCGEQVRVRRVVGNDSDLGRTGEKVYTHGAEELALSLRNVGVASTHDHVHWLDLLVAERDRGQSLYASKAQDLVGPRGRHRVDHGLVDTVGP